MKQVFKYELEIKDNQEVIMPLDAEILTAQIQQGTLCLWALVRSSSKVDVRKFEIYGTGHVVPEAMGHLRKYIATCQTHDGSGIWHVFEYTGI